MEKQLFDLKKTLTNRYRQQLEVLQEMIDNELVAVVNNGEEVSNSLASILQEARELNRQISTLERVERLSK
jgi:hypothetical protein